LSGADQPIPTLPIESLPCINVKRPSVIPLGRAIYLYNLLTEEEMIHIPKPTQEGWDQYNKIGIPITHPGGIPATDARAWIDIALPLQ
jgi:hypothetical protein